MGLTEPGDQPAPILEEASELFQPVGELQRKHFGSPPPLVGFFFFEKRVKKFLRAFGASRAAFTLTRVLVNVRQPTGCHASSRSYHGTVAT